MVKIEFCIISRILNYQSYRIMCFQNDLKFNQVHFKHRKIPIFANLESQNSKYSIFSKFGCNWPIFTFSGTVQIRVTVLQFQNFKHLILSNKTFGLEVNLSLSYLRSLSALLCQSKKSTNLCHYKLLKAPELDILPMSRNCFPKLAFFP